MLEKYLKERDLPDVLEGAVGQEWEKRRRKMLELLSKYVYGYTPKFNTRLYSYVEAREETACNGLAICEWIRLSFQTPGGMYSFPFQLILPKKEGRYPTFLHIAFRGKEESSFGIHEVNEQIPVEELILSGYAVANLFYEDVTSDGPQKDGLARAYGNTDLTRESEKNDLAGTSENDGKSSWGKIGMWAFAASRVMDYLEMRDEIDSEKVAVSGWSRLGKTALWCGAQDERFALVISTESGCCGAALQRGKKGEKIQQITDRFPYWFCEKFGEFSQKEEELPLDQHFLLGCIAPRALFVGSAEEDSWADPESEFLGAAAASEVYEMLGVKGLETKGQLPQVGEKLFGGKIGYMMRPGCHGMSLLDWRAHMEFWEKDE